MSIFKELAQKGVHIIGKTEDMTCELCGQEDEVRPYGPNGELVCFLCGMKDEASARRQFERLHK